ncbi:DUF21 domain-containing protein At1g55930, chloroplastic-like isoform X2 [Rosa rugosa]|uniref:DUF21 domain-containing protein At1g55930, chloroplastic-like isoform X2 n=1 Tax=Rosa rugosa TaxID=74645 RepID=UPI002B4142E6|nr:DUF21 domain-containing protein At1g55930, chloroplastic-like isoform X2 [Rosa rugosa]
MALESSILSPPRFISGSKSLSFLYYHKQKNFPNKVLVQNNRYPFRLVSNCIGNSDFRRFLGPRCEGVDLFANRARLRAVGKDSESSSGTNAVSGLGFDFVRVMVKCGVVLAAMVCGVLVYGSRRAFAVEGVVNASYGIVDRCILMFRNAWPKTLLVLQVFKEQGLILAALLGLSAFFSMAETSITTLWPWKVRELAEKEPENGVFRLLRNDVTRFLTTILIGTTVVNIGATALVTEAATAIFGEAGVSAATGVMTVLILLLTEITPKSVAVHNPTEVARFVASGLAFIGTISCRKSCYISINGDAENSRVERKKDMIENVLEIKDTHVREVMTPLVDVVAIDASATLIDFHDLWVTHQYSRVPVFEQRVDNIVGIAYAMDLLDYVQKGELLESTTVGDMAQKPGYFVPDSMSVWNLLREFRIRKVHMAVVLNEYGGTVGIITLEDVVEEIVGEIFDENDSKEEIQKKTGYIVMRAEGVFDVDANTSIDQLSEDLNVKMPEGHQYETVSGFICEAFGYIPRTGESIKVVLEKENEEENDESKSEKQEKKEKHQIFKLEILAGNARKVGAVRFERLENDTATLETKEVARLVPKIVKRKSSSGHDSDGGEYDEDSFQKRPHLEISDEHEDTVDNLSRH